MNQEFDSFANTVHAVGLIPVQHTEYHWQIRGGQFTVNYYPTTSTIYINGTHSERGCRQKGHWKDAIEAATKIPNRRRTGTVTRPTRNRQLKRKLLAKSSVCIWCGKALTLNTATLEHIIPLKRGGSNGMDNLGVACKRCNQTRGHDMPELAAL